MNYPKRLFLQRKPQVVLHKSRGHRRPTLVLKAGEMGEQALREKVDTEWFKRRTRTYMDGTEP